MTMSDNEVQSPNSKEEGLTIVTENGFSSGQEVNKVKDSAADGGGSMVVEMTKSDISAGENCAHLKKEQTSSSHRKPKRSISFPQESCVSGYCDPPDPWKQAPKWTAQDVLTAYKRSCDKHGTKPLSKILQQVEALSCNGKRADKLVVKGEKVDMKQCEAFEEIMRRVQFKTVDLESCHLDDETAVALFDMIEFYESAQYLNIAFNKSIGVRGWQACSRLIRRTPCLTTLDLRNCDMNDRSIPIFGRALKLGSHLTVLHMENMYLSGRSLILLVAALKMNEILQELFLADNRLMPSDGIQLGNLLKYNHSLTLLDLRNNHLQDVGVGHVCDGLYEQNLDKGLRTLVLWNNQVTHQSMASLSRALGSTKCLETLNLGHNNVTNEGIHILKEGLLKSKSLMRLGLQATRLTCEGAVALAEYVADSIHLLRLDLRENDIKTAGLMALSLALKVNDSVTRMDLDKETKKESGMKDYADQQRRLQQEIGGYMERNQQAVLHREEEDRRRLEERAQVEMAARASVQSAITSAQEAIQAHPEMMYVSTPTSPPEPGEKRRPSLLFQAHRLTPQESLESPHCSEVDFFTGGKHDNSNGDRPSPQALTTVSSPPLTLELSNPLTANQPVGGAGTVIPPSQGGCEPGAGGVEASSLPPLMSNPSLSRMRSPPSELLLSPQYYPRPTARKIFNVSRVVEASTAAASPTVSKTGVLDTGATGTANTPTMRLAAGGGSGSGGGGAPSPISPTLLCQDLSAKTVSDYIQQIVSDPDLLTSPGAVVRQGSSSNDPMEVKVEGGEGGERGGRQEPVGRIAVSFLEEEEEEEGSGSMDPLGVMQVETSSLSCDSVAAGISTAPSDGMAAGSSTAPSSLVDLVSPDKKQTLAESSAPLEVKVEEEGAVSWVGDGGVDRHADSSRVQGEAVSTNSDLCCIPQLLLQAVVDSSVDDVPATTTTTSSSNDASNSDPHRTLSTGPAIAVVPQKDDFASELEKLDREWDSQTESVTEVETGEDENTNSEKAQAQPLRPTPPLLSAVEESSLFRTLEFPDFDINDEDLSLFGGAAMGSSKPKAAPSDPQEGEKGKGRGAGREVSPSLGDTWTTVDAASLGGQGAEVEEEEEEKPDFFTTLSMNGLTQELASVLNSIDGKVDLDSQENQCTASATLQESQESEDSQSFA